MSPLQNQILLRQMLSQQGSHTRKLQEALRGLISRDGAGEGEASPDGEEIRGGAGKVDATLAKRPSAVRGALAAMLERVSQSERRTHSLERQRAQDQVRGRLVAYSAVQGPTRRWSLPPLPHRRPYVSCGST